MAKKVSGGKSTKLIRGQEVDTSAYGATATGAATQIFWDDPIFDENGDPLGIEGSLYGTSPWDRVMLNGQILPGLWEATATPAIQLDVQKPNGFDGAALVSRGYVPAGITITGRIWTPEQWTEFQRILPTFWARPNHYAVNDTKRATGQIVGEQKAVTVAYPGLAAFNIHALVIKQITPPEPTSDKGVRQIKIIAVEYVPVPAKQKSAVKKAKGQSADLTVQADQILDIDKNHGGARRARPANAPRKPSKSQARNTGPLKVTL
jgi:hypothetical protein